MDFRTDLAVVDDQYFYTCKKKWAHGGFGDISDLALAAEMHGLKHVWAVTGTGVSLLAQSPFADTPDAADAWNVTGIGGDAFSYLSVRRAEKTYEDHIELGFPEWSRWPWKKSSSSPSLLLRTVIQLEEILGFPPAYTPAWTVLEFFKRQNLGRWDWLEPVTVNLETEQVNFSYANDVARELHWPPKGQELQIPEGATHLIRMDGNSDYNAAETGLNVGQGNPKWAAPGPAVEMECYNGKRPGIWFVEVFNEGTVWDGKRLPALDSWRCMTTDMIEQARRSGCKIIVKMGWYWEQYHQTLRSTADLLWKQRQFWRSDVKLGNAVSESIYDTIRAMLKALHGKLAREDNAPRFRRRDIWALVVARAVAMRIYKIEKIHREYGLWPVRIKADEFTYAVTDPHIFDAMMGTDKLGGLKHVETIEIHSGSKTL